MDPLPAASVIPVRRPARFVTAEIPLYWNGGEPFATHYMNALSSVFPDGEAFFVRSVLHYRDRIDDPELLRAIQGFAGQESQHRAQHDHHLDLLIGAQRYTALARLNRMADAGMRFGNRHWPKFSLASTAAVEHLTALLARRILSDPGFTAAMDPRMAELWKWHSVEEAEHKAVAYDVLQRVAPSFALRAFALALNSIGLFLEVLVRTAYMLGRDGVLFSRATWASGWRFLFARGGLLRGHARDYFAWYRRGFHPGQIDDRPWIEAWQRAGGSAIASR